MYKMVSQYRPTRISQWKNLRRVRGVQKRQKPYLIEASNSQIFELATLSNSTMSTNIRKFSHNGNTSELKFWVVN
uniref:Ovule protein n=1 Tax=Meloidogyne incognita TaxID=6306 RepID=A0A914M604_MELIC